MLFDKKTKSFKKTGLRDFVFYVSCSGTDQTDHARIHFETNSVPQLTNRANKIRDKSNLISDPVCIERAKRNFLKKVHKKFKNSKSWIGVRCNPLAAPHKRDLQRMSRCAVDRVYFL